MCQERVIRSSTRISIFTLFWICGPFLAALTAGPREDMLAGAAAGANDRRIVELLLGGADIDGGKTSETPLMVAVRHGHTATVRELLEFGADPNRSDRNGDTPLLLACHANRPEIAALLLEHGSDPHAANRRDNFPLLVAADRGSLAIVRSLLAHGADPRRKRKDDGRQALYQAAKAYPQIVRLLVEEHGVPVDLRTKAGSTPLMVASFRANPEIVAYLLSKGADAKARRKDGRDALYYVLHPSSMRYMTSEGSYAVLERLREAGAPIDRRYRHGATLLAVFLRNSARAYRRDYRNIYTLIKAGLALQALDDDGLPLEYYANNRQAKGFLAALRDPGIRAELLRSGISPEEYRKREEERDLARKRRAEEELYRRAGERKEEIEQQKPAPQPEPAQPDGPDSETPESPPRTKPWYPYLIDATVKGDVASLLRLLESNTISSRVALRAFADHASHFEPGDQWHELFEWLEARNALTDQVLLAEVWAKGYPMPRIRHLLVGHLKKPELKPGHTWMAFCGPGSHTFLKRFMAARRDIPVATFFAKAISCPAHPEAEANVRLLLSKMEPGDLGLSWITIPIERLPATLSRLGPNDPAFCKIYEINIIERIRVYLDNGWNGCENEAGESRALYSYYRLARFKEEYNNPRGARILDEIVALLEGRGWRNSRIELVRALQAGEEDRAERLLRAGTTVDDWMLAFILKRASRRLWPPATDNYAGRIAPLQVAIQQDRPDYLAYLIREEEIAPNLLINDQPALVYESFRKSASMFRTQLELGADPRRRARDGDQLLHRIARGSRVLPESVLDLLRESGADVNALDTKGRTPLEIARENSNQPKLVKYLERHGAKTAAELRGPPG